MWRSVLKCTARSGQGWVRAVWTVSWKSHAQLQGLLSSSDVLQSMLLMCSVRTQAGTDLGMNTGCRGSTGSAPCCHFSFFSSLRMELDAIGECILADPLGMWASETQISHWLSNVTATLSQRGLRSHPSHTRICFCHWATSYETQRTQGFCHSFLYFFLYQPAS